MKANMEGSSVLRAISKQTGQVSPTHTKERALIEHVSLFLYSSSTTDEANFDGGLLVTIDAPKVRIRQRACAGIGATITLRGDCSIRQPLKMRAQIVW